MVEAVWRIESARLVASLARLVGDVGLAEELAQDNLAAAVEKRVARHRSCLAEPADTTLDEPDETETAEPTGAMAERRRAHHALVHELPAQGAGFRRIARHLGWSHRTVSKYARAATRQDPVVGQKPGTGLVDPFKPYLARPLSVRQVTGAE
ncbi:hypothetical protein [Actinoplanes missouriensis]|uniref:hypothetical protein n=1 Tax=Actinoplanes missouriensis TaxID=1866 RepID=UPI0002F78AB5|nr:hypothetical protein [Actinoplanes missouriensis]